MPIPPTRWTSKLFSTRALTPRSQKTILPAAAAVSVFSWQRRAGEAGVPNVTSWPVAEPVPADAPLYVTPSILAEPAPTRSCVSAATVVIHGLGCATVETAGPSLPAEAATNTFASAAFRNATSTPSRKLFRVPLIE